MNCLYPIIPSLNNCLNALYKIAFVICLLALNSATAFGQRQHTVRGRVQDSTRRDIAGATVTVYNGKDTSRTTSNEHGLFMISRLTKTDYTITITSIGHATYTGSFKFGSNTDTLILEAITLPVVSKVLSEVKVKAPKPIVFKEDTVEYDAAAYRVNKEDLVADLMRQLPGLDVDDEGNFTSQGKKLYKLRVNGHDFFTGDVQQFINQLPARIIDKIQVIDDYGDDAAFTGIKKGEPRKMLNLVIKQGMNWGQFGNIGLRGGTNELWGGDANGNYWKDARQLGGGLNLNQARNVGGTNSNESANLSLSDRFKVKNNISTNYSYSDNQSHNSNSFFQQTNSELGTLFNSTNSLSSYTNHNHNISLNVNLIPQKTSYLNISGDAGFNKGEGVGNSSSSQSGLINQDLGTESISQTNGHHVNMNLSYGLRFKKPGKLMLINAGINNGNNDNVQSINNQIRYFTPDRSFLRDSVLDRIVNTRNNNTAVSVAASYTQPINAHSGVNANYRINTGFTNNKLITNAASTGQTLHYVDSLSNSLRSVSFSQSADITYQYFTKKLRFNQSLGLQQNSLSNASNASAPIKTNQFNFAPFTSISYSINQTSNFNFTYNNFSNSPSVYQLQPVRDTRNLQNIIIGNPDLKQSISHSANIGYSHSGLKTGQIFSINFRANVTQNAIVSNTVFVKDTTGNLRQETHYYNANGNYNVNGGYNYSFGIGPAKKSIVGISLNGSVNYLQNIQFSDNIRGLQKGVSLMQNINAGFNISKKLNLSTSVRYQSTHTTYTAGNGIDNTFQTLGLRLNCSWRITNNTVFSTDANKQFNKGYAAGYGSNPFIMNFNFRQQILKRKLSLSIQGSDLFNQANQTAHYVSGNSITDNRTHYITRYFTLGVTYNLSRFASGD